MNATCFWCLSFPVTVTGLQADKTVLSGKALHSIYILSFDILPNSHGACMHATHLVDLRLMLDENNYYSENVLSAYSVSGTMPSSLY